MMFILDIAEAIAAGAFMIARGVSRLLTGKVPSVIDVKARRVM